MYPSTLVAMNTEHRGRAMPATVAPGAGVSRHWRGLRGEQGPGEGNVGVAHARPGLVWVAARACHTLASRARDAMTTHDPLLGAVLRRTYQVERLLGAGGMGAVYAVQHLRTRRRYALK